MVYGTYDDPEETRVKHQITGFNISVPGQIAAGNDTGKLHGIIKKI